MLDKLIDATIDYTRQRKVFGKSVLDNQVVHFRLAELRTEVEALRSLTWRAVEDYVAGKDVTKLASMAKLKCGRLIREVANSCLQYWGGMGYTWDNPLSRALRDGRLVSIGGGADEVMLGIICKLEGTLPREKKVNPVPSTIRARFCLSGKGASCMFGCTGRRFAMPCRRPCWSSSWIRSHRLRRAVSVSSSCAEAAGISRRARTSRIFGRARHAHRSPQRPCSGNQRQIRACLHGLFAFATRHRRGA